MDQDIVQSGSTADGSVAGDPGAEDKNVNAACTEDQNAASGRQQHEAPLYGPMCEAIREYLVVDHDQTPIAVKVTANSNKKQDLGSWSIPDIASVAVRTFKYSRPIVEVRTFEIKPENAVNVLGVYEALAHRRWSTHSYVIFHTPSYDVDDGLVKFPDIVAAAQPHGIGVVSAPSFSHYDWGYLVEAQGSTPDPEQLDQFIDLFFPEVAETILSTLNAVEPKS